ncbi:ACT domain-containing protein [Corynebacterium sp. 153RC1]|uniref:ACT domain-containing protein n=1 Tax=Corynebacterium TaxID=1716 RepID=UPI00211BEC50|nr:MULTISPECIES: ACT domain-containing protein [unclassified Corynebacterium]MCQ9369944.1 ACT domain-containing protein [Corynebacterium sp. 35RC1]MCQ9343598.1 ACT domain-containing protein [Corynebacterium sp. 76QC2CO]MCQ9352063.1 ACT domain-containing protein [Corynebacterium sp. 209RC1]MCQ9353812.1 ACT domain-containing protein [Corynebacterium sp. 1222RC1]MCQ9356204.1 ACT domain-containing protein [Corynebacterium sp. 122RC1]
MSYLIRVLMPDRPGSLGRIANAIGEAGANIHSVDVVQVFPNGTVMDDMVVSLPPDVMADAIITAAQALDGVEVDSIRPFSGTVDRRGQIQLLATVAGASTHSEALVDLVNRMPQALTSNWAVLLDVRDGVSRVTASPAAPEEDGSTPTHIEVTTARTLNPEREQWIPESWSLLDSSLAAAPLGDTGLVLVIGRVGGPDFLASEVQHIGNLAVILGRLLRH